MALATDWKAAKTKFETATGVSKPTKLDGVWKVKWRKKSGLEEAFKKVDHFIDGKSQAEWLDLSAKDMKNWRKAIDDLKKSHVTYLPEIEKAIQAEKNGTGGKDASAVYRDLKILKTDLAKFVTRAEFDYAQVVAYRETELGGMASQCKAFYQQIRKIRENLQNGIAKALSKGQGILKSGVPKDYNDNIESMARDITQPLQNIRDFSFPVDIIRPDKQEKVYEALEDKDFFQQARALFEYSQHARGEITQILVSAGDTPFDATIVRMANNPPKLATTASADDVKRAAKHVIGLVKAAEKINAKLK